MTRLLPLLFLGGVAAELVSIMLVGRLLGVIPTLLLILLGGIAGFSMIRQAGMGIVEALRSPVQSGSLQQGAAGKAVAGVISGVLFIIPGFFSDALGLLLLLPSVRQWLRARIPMEQHEFRRSARQAGETIIEGEAVEITGEISSHGRPRGDGPASG